MTLIILGFDAIPKPTNEAREKERRLEQELQTLVKGWFLVTQVVSF